jgi:hypothetical protein
MTAAFGPERWAIEITKLLNLVLGPEHFPIDVIKSIFPAYPGNSAPPVWPQNSPGSAVGIREIFGDDTFGDPADNRRVEPAG